MNSLFMTRSFKVPHKSSSLDISADFEGGFEGSDSKVAKVRIIMINENAALIENVIINFVASLCSSF